MKTPKCFGKAIAVEFYVRPGAKRDVVEREAVKFSAKYQVNVRWQFNSETREVNYINLIGSVADAHEEEKGTESD
jgi:hypothetical protein